MRYHYCTILDNIEVTQTPLDKLGQTIVHIEIPDEKYCFKTLDCIVPSFNVGGVVGLTDEEVAFWVTFCRHNASALLHSAKQGGIANAEYI